MDLLLNCQVVRGVTEYLVRWRGYASPADASAAQLPGHSGAGGSSTEYLVRLRGYASPADAGGGAGQFNVPRPGGGVRCHRAARPALPLAGPSFGGRRRPGGRGRGRDPGPLFHQRLGPGCCWCAAPAARCRAGTVTSGGGGGLAGGWYRRGPIRPGAGGPPAAGAIPLA